jgi:hypothetical protein
LWQVKDPQRTCYTDRFDVHPTSRNSREEKLTEQEKFFAGSGGLERRQLSGQQRCLGGSSIITVLGLRASLRICAGRPARHSFHATIIK